MKRTYTITLSVECEGEDRHTLGYADKEASVVESGIDSMIETMEDMIGGAYEAYEVDATYRLA